MMRRPAHLRKLSPGPIRWHHRDAIKGLIYLPALD
jgi:hypothetical protein